MVFFGTLQLAHVLEAQIQTSRQEIERPIPYRNIAYRTDHATMGRSLRISGEIREDTISDAALKIEMIRRLNDGSARLVDLEDGETPAFNALLADPEYELAVEDWFTDDYRVAYSLTFLEVEAP